MSWRYFLSFLFVRILIDVISFFPDKFLSIYFLQGKNMKLVYLFFFLASLGSCGQKTQEKSGENELFPNDKERCVLNGKNVPCKSLEIADGLGIDILESMIEVPVIMSNSEITFLEDKKNQSTGRRITCATSVKNGEVYKLIPRGENLLVMTSLGSYEMKRLSEGEGILGAWVWNGYVDQGTHVIKNMTILDFDRVVLRTTCEL
jgi:hypothetical protein